MADADELLLRTSRTFALAIPLLPEPTRTEVKIAYLLFRIIDTFEDAHNWTPDRRAEALGRFIDLLDAPPGQAARQMTDACAQQPPVDRADYLELLAHIPYVLEEFQRLQPLAREYVSVNVGRTAEGMTSFVARTNGSGALTLETLRDLRDYCYTVAGIVGEMLTELYLLGRPELDPIGAELRARAARFG